ncbi:MAG: DUF5336 domain-containing protein [Frankiaceae bacterium]
MVDHPAGAASLDDYDRLHLAVVGAGVLAFIFSFLPYYGVSVSFAGTHASSSVTAWHSYAVLGDLCLLAATALAAVHVFRPALLPSDLPVKPFFAVAALAGIGTLLLILRAVTLPSPSGLGVSVGVRWGAYLLFLAGIAQTVTAVLAARAEDAATRPVVSAPEV